MSIVSVRGVHRRYENGAVPVKALDGVDLEIAQGEFTALMGPSGSGKTTLLNCIGGLDEPTEGDVTVDGQDVGAMSKRERSELRLQRIGFVFQAYNLVPVLTAYENAEFVLMLQGVPEARRREQVMGVLEAVGLQGMEHRRPNELSGGPPQRGAGARASAAAPARVRADEPTANLDSRTGTELVELMARLNEERGITFVFATHDPKVMRRARRIVHLVDGKVDSDVVQ